MALRLISMGIFVFFYIEYSSLAQASDCNNPNLRPDDRVTCWSKFAADKKSEFQLQINRIRNEINSLPVLDSVKHDLQGQLNLYDASWRTYVLNRCGFESLLIFGAASDFSQFGCDARLTTEQMNALATQERQILSLSDKQ